MADAPSTRLDRLALVSLCVAVAVAFADSSIVVLALPQLLVRFDTSVEAISWVITSYNLVVTVAALLLVRIATPERTQRLLAAGLTVFLLGSAGCAVSQGLASLVALRSVQGLGGALLLVASLPRLAALAGSRTRGIAWWAVSGAVGAALGPALGGALTEAFDWRAIFVLQVPLAAAAALALRTRGGLGGEPEHLTHPRERLGANLSLGLLSGALVGALFLAVVLLINGWQMRPIAAAGVVSVLPFATFVVRPVTRALGGPAAAAVGAVLLAGGLLGLAFLPGASILFAALALVLCGLGLGLAIPPLTASSLDPHALDGSGARTIAARHAGLVIALVALTPVLAHDLSAAQDRAIDRGANTVLDADVPISAKVPLARDLGRTLRDVPDAEIPNFRPVFARHETASNRSSLEQLRSDLVGVIEDMITRSTRRAFFVCALLAAAALLPLPLLRLRRPA